MRYMLALAVFCSLAYATRRKVLQPSSSVVTGNTSYSQNFDSLAATGSSTVLPADWHIRETGATSNTSYTAGNGSVNTPDTYSFGATPVGDRALGTLVNSSSTFQSMFGAEFAVTGPLSLESLTVSYVGEQWRLGAAGRVDALDFQYSTNATSLNSGTWNDVDTLDLTSKVTTGPAGFLNGNLVANRKSITDTFTLR